MSELNYPDHFYNDAIKKESPSAYRSTEFNDHESVLRTALSYINHARSLILEELVTIAKPIDARKAKEEWDAMNRRFDRDYLDRSAMTSRGPDKLPPEVKQHRRVARADELPPNLVAACNPMHHVTLQMRDAVIKPGDKL
jgi:hypothetical protein